ncbi:MAG: RimK-like ATP-grasp domain, partial [Thermoleophilia bacterium]|nr:RimK-like ATP-grasp domain [Thermoleophilia bacterium]
MPGPINVSAIAEAAVRVRPPVAAAAEAMLPFGDDAARALSGTAATGFDRELADMMQLTLDMPRSQRPRIVIVGIGRTPPLTTQSIIEQAAAKGLVPGGDIIATRYADLRIGKERGFVRLAKGTGADGMVVAGQGQQALFLFRGGGNLKPYHLEKIAKIQTVEGATALTDLSAIERLGSKDATNAVLEKIGSPLAATIPVRGADQAISAFDQITTRFGDTTAVLKKVNSLGGKDVHFVTSHDQIREVIAREPDAGFVMQEFLPAAKDQDIRVHGVYDAATGRYRLPNSYVRNRNAFQLTPNLANGGFPTNYILSPWEEQEVLRAMDALAAGSEHPPLHVGLDLFPRKAITASAVERNHRLQEAVRAGTMSLDEAVAASRDTVVIGEAATSAGTKGTEL